VDIYEITGNKTGVSREGVNFLEPADSFQNLLNGFIYRQVLQSRQGFKQFSSTRLADGSRVMGIFEHIIPADNTKELLAISKNFLYIYVPGTDTFNQVPMAGSAPVGGFGIVSNGDYVSGTSYPFADGSQRFVFSGKGMSDIYMYDGTDVQSFTLDNADYQAPASGAITRSTYVIWFGERLNLIAPYINNILQPQAVLYSGIRDTDGNGDKFNVPGSGMLSGDTYEFINGATIRGNTIAVNFNRSNWTLEKTRDAFNPYFFRKVPSVLGTDAGFSAVAWNDEVKSIGKTGIISTDGRESLRVDSKIPYFTADDIDANDFDLTYGGFDRTNSQFMFAYKSAASSDITTQDKVLVNNYEENTWSVYDQRFSCFGQTDKGQDLVWNDIYEVNNPSWARWDTTEEIWNKIGIEAATQKTLAGDDEGFIYELNADYDDYVVAITGITQAANAVITTVDQAFEVGDRVSITSVQGMTQINDENQFTYATVTAATLTTITVNIDSTDYSAYISGGIISKIISFYAETIPFNPYRSEGRKCYVSHVEFLLDTNAGHLLVDVYEDEEESPFKADILLEPQGIEKAREWVTMTVNQEANFLTFVLKQESASVQVRQTSMRIHCSMGGLTSS
jgi:hypothetical protein